MPDKSSARTFVELGLRIGVHEALGGFSRRRPVGLHNEFLEPRNGPVLRGGLDHLWMAPRLQSVETCSLESCVDFRVARLPSPNLLRGSLEFIDLKRTCR